MHMHPNFIRYCPLYGEYVIPAGLIKVKEEFLSNKVLCLKLPEAKYGHTGSYVWVVDVEP
jgi:hypothetical protein